MIEVAPLSTEIRANWHNAVLYCEFLNIDGKKDWRLPTLEELIELDGDLDGKWCWSGTEDDSELNAWTLEYQQWQPDMRQLTGKHVVLYVRAVRDI
jgi:hypothetical protein